MKNILFILSFLVFSSVAFAKNTPSYHILDIEFINNLPFINIEIEDQKVKCLVDTGARNQVLVLEKKIIDKLTTLRPFSVKEKSFDITGKKYIASKYVLPKFNIGDVSFLQLRLVEDTNWGLKSQDNIEGKDGVIGLELFIDKGIIIDYKNKKFVVVDGKFPAEYDVENWHDLKFKVDRFGISIFAEINGQEPRKFILDTGANISIIKSKFIENEAVSVLNLKANSLDLGNILISGYNFPPEFEPDGILGYDFLDGRAIYIDFAKRITKLRL